MRAKTPLGALPSQPTGSSYLYATPPRSSTCTPVFFLVVAAYGFIRSMGPGRRNARCSSNITASEAATILQQRDRKKDNPAHAQSRATAEADVWARPSGAIANQKTRAGKGGSAAESIWTNEQMGSALVSRRPARFTQGDVARAIRATKAAGAPSVQIKPDGTIIVFLLKPAAEPETNEAVEPEEHFVL
jgi:hypothetical protein